MARRNNRSLVKPNANVAANARRIVAAQTAAFFAQERYLNDPNASTELHAMRIAAKRLRYTMELFSAVLGSDVEGCLDAIREFQEIAGEIHDADARAGVFREYLYARVTDQADMLAALAAGAVYRYAAGRVDTAALFLSNPRSTSTKLRCKRFAL